MGWLDRIHEINEAQWKPVSTLALIASSGFIAAISWFANGEHRWVPILDTANLAFHEAGHPLFGLVSSRLTVYGGTLGQLAFPIVATIAFWLRREAVSCAIAAVWLNENLWNIATYMGDARIQLLPLVGNGEHDWAHIFSSWGVLHLDTAIAGFVRLIGWIGTLAAWGWLAWRWNRDREQA
jgi:hypothetical protein